MITTVTQTNMIPIPDEVSRKFGIQLGWRLDWFLPGQRAG